MTTLDRSSRYRTCTWLCMFLLVVSICSAAFTARADIQVGSIADSRFLSTWTLDGSSMTRTRAKLLDAANFGPGGTVPEAIVITDTVGPINAALLSSFDVFFIGFLFDFSGNSFTAAELTAFDTWVNGGGVMVITCDDVRFDAVCASFGHPVIDTLSQSAVQPTDPTAAGLTHPVFDGPFGMAPSVRMGGTQGFFTNTAGATVIGEDQVGNPTVLVRSVGAGHIVLFSDVDMISNFFISGGTGITNNNDRFLGNVFAHAASVASPVVVFDDQPEFVAATGAAIEPIPDSDTAFPATACGSLGADTGRGPSVTIGFDTNSLTITQDVAGTSDLCIFDDGKTVPIANTNPSTMDGNTIVANGEDDYLLVFDDPVPAVGFRLLTNIQANEVVTLRDEFGADIAVININSLTAPNTRQFVGFLSPVTAIKSVLIDTVGGASQNEGIDEIKIAPVIFSKRITSGPDEDADGEIDVVVEVGQLDTTVYDFTMTYTNPGGPPVLIVDTAPAEWIVKEVEGFAVNVDACGESDNVFNGFGSVDVFKSGKLGKKCRGSTKILWTPDPDGGAINVVMETRQSPGTNNVKFAPTSCGPLFLNSGLAKVFEVDPATGEPLRDPVTGELLPPLITAEPLLLAAVEDVDGDGIIVPDGSGNEDGDALTDLEDVLHGFDPCSVGTGTLYEGTDEEDFALESVRKV